MRLPFDDYHDVYKLHCFLYQNATTSKTKIPIGLMHVRCFL